MASQLKTSDTDRPITAPTLPISPWDTGYEYMETAEHHGWTTISSWGQDGWDFGAWPYIIGFIREQPEDKTSIWGFGTYIEGDLTTRYFEHRDAMIEAIDREAFFYWKLGQSDGPENLPERFENLPQIYRGAPRY